MNIIIRYGLAFAILVVLILGLFEFILMPAYVRQNQSRYVLDLRGLTLEDAQARISAEGFKEQVYDTLYTNQYQPGTVMDQFPRPNARVKPGRTIRLKIARPERMVPIPELVGQSRRGAELQLQQLGLKIDTVYQEYNPAYPQGTVAWQFPKPGDHIKKGLGVQITVSKGTPPNFYQVPQLFGLSLTSAKRRLVEARLKVGKISYRENEDLVPFTVLDQAIPAGTVLEKAVTVDLIVSVLDIQDIFDQLTHE